MRQTKKLVEAQKALKALPSGQRGLMKRDATQDDYYQALEKAGYFWDSTNGKWQKGDENSRARGQFSGSIFEDESGLATGVFRLRVMANDSELDDICAEISRAITARGMSVIEISEKAYPNRRGAGVRRYFTCKRGK